jgi:multidrug efflux pump subunit AcrA (membrane-fusion protein)
MMMRPADSPATTLGSSLVSPEIGWCCAGVLAEIFVKDGGYVEAGTVVGTIDQV